MFIIYSFRISVVVHTPPPCHLFKKKVRERKTPPHVCVSFFFMVHPNIEGRGFSVGETRIRRHELDSWGCCFSGSYHLKEFINPFFIIARISLNESFISCTLVKG